MYLKKVCMHLKTILKHKWWVFKLSIRAGIPIRGFFHDISKFSPTEFFDNVKYIEDVTFSPITSAKRKVGYSKAWLHHRGKNKHHPEYWYDEHAPLKSPLIEYKYAVEMVCDKLAAGIVYSGGKFIPQRELEYVKNSSDNKLLHEKTYNFIIEIFTELTSEPIKKVINKKNLKKVYNEICLEK